MKLKIIPEEGGEEIQDHVLSLSYNQLVCQLLNDENRIEVECLKDRSQARTIVTDRKGKSLIGHSFILPDGKIFDSTIESFCDDNDSIKEWIFRNN